MKTKEELNALKEEIETVNKKLAELTEEELAQVSGGNWMGLLKDVVKDSTDAEKPSCYRFTMTYGMLSPIKPTCLSCSWKYGCGNSRGKSSVE